MFAHAFVSGGKESGEVELKAGVSRDKPNSWCAVSQCYVRKELFKNKAWAYEAQTEICKTMCHWRQWVEEDDK